MTQITENIYLGSITETKNEFLVEHNISLILNFARECEYDSNVKQLHFKFDDDHRQNLLSHFDGVVDIIKQHVENKGVVLIHCFAGKSRSVSFVLAYLMKEQHMSLYDAFKYVSEKRDVYPNISFIEQLIKYEKLTFDLTESSFDYDDYVIGFIADVSNKSKDIVKEVYNGSGKDVDKTFDKLF